MFLDENYLLSTPEAVRIHAAVARLPIVDAHNHADVAALAADRPVPDLWTLLGESDHYVWEVMRKAGVEETFITGDAPAAAKFRELARVAPRLAGNPAYEWLHLDLRFLGIDRLLDADSADAIWQEGLHLLARPENSPSGLIERSNIEVMASTDDPADTLADHRTVNNRAGRTLVRPTWRPDRALKLGQPGWREWVSRLGGRYEFNITAFEGFMAALKASHEFFAASGCRASDHGVEVMPASCGDEGMAKVIYDRVWGGASPTCDEITAFQAYLLREFTGWNARAGWVTQLHMGPVRDVRERLWESLGPDAGGDVSSLMQDQLPGLLPLLNAWDGRAKFVLYCLEPAYQPTLATLSRAFGSSVAPGSAWWFNDTPEGMKRQLEYLAGVDLLSGHAGMVSDSRKLTSYQSRFAVFRRVLAEVLGGMCRAGRMPEEIAVDLAKYIAYERPKQFFDL